ncbi:hypothetical protein ACFE04_013500 [Oxalis oulophora]
MQHLCMKVPQPNSNSLGIGREENDDSFKKYLIGSKDVSDLFKKAIEDVEVEARSTNGPPVAELVKIVTLEARMIFGFNFSTDEMKYNIKSANKGEDCCGPTTAVAVDWWWMWAVTGVVWLARRLEERQNREES